VKKKITTVMLIAFFIFVAGGWSLLLAGEGGAGERAVGPDGLIRLHIIANSDSVADQAIKYQVRDAVTAYLAPRLADSGSPAAARRIVAENRAEILAVAGRTLAAAGAGYSASIETGYFDFPLRAYGTLVLPPGRYEAVRILLGAAAGQNWWCVLFPPLCFIDGATAAATPLGGVSGQPAAGRIELRWKINEIINLPLNKSPERYDNKSKETIGTGESGTDAGGIKIASDQ
jgi:stage II sporulation protein R